MAEITASNSEKRKGSFSKSHNRRSTRVDLTPMVDLGFLLITFFVFTTSMAEPKAMDLIDAHDGEPKPVKELGKVGQGKEDKEPDFSGDTFYGVKIDRSNPMLSHNLLRLKNRFQERYEDSLKKAEARKEQGKAPHQTTEKSIQENQERLRRVEFIINTLVKQSA